MGVYDAAQVALAGRDAFEKAAAYLDAAAVSQFDLVGVALFHDPFDKAALALECLLAELEESCGSGEAICRCVKEDGEEQWCVTSQVCRAQFRSYIKKLRTWAGDRNATGRQLRGRARLLREWGSEWLVAHMLL